MVSQITQGIRVSVVTQFENAFTKNDVLHYAFSYQVTIENQGKDTVQLIQRHWEIHDALNHVQVVDGEGVIGKKPVLHPGESHTYKSGCLLSSPYGGMSGYYTMINFSSTRRFQTRIPSFPLLAGFALN